MLFISVSPLSPGEFVLTIINTIIKLKLFVSMIRLLAFLISTSLDNDDVPKGLIILDLDFVGSGKPTTFKELSKLLMPNSHISAETESGE